MISPQVLEHLKIEANKILRAFKASIALHCIFLCGQMYAITLMNLVYSGADKYNVMYCKVEGEMYCID